MIDDATITVTVADSMRGALAQLSAQTGRDIPTLVREAIEEYLTVQASQIASIDAAIAEADAGAPRISNDVVMAWLESWETPNELPPPA